MTIPGHILKQLNLADGTTRDQLAVALESGASTFPLMILSSPEARKGLQESLDAYQSQRLELLPCTTRLTAYSYKEIQFLDGRKITIACFPEELPGGVSPPSRCEMLLLVRWLLDPTFALSNWDVEQKGKALIVWPEDLFKSDVHRSLVDVITTSIADGAVALNVSPLLTADTVQFGDLKRFNDDHFTKNLTASALQESNLKWRFLGLYRIMENGYLWYILQNIKTKFMDDPGRTIEQASDALKNEVSRFLELTKICGLETIFDAFQVAFDTLIASNSVFAVGLSRAAAPTMKKNQANAKWQRGVIHCYKIRCSIAHAGGSDVYIERYADWRNGLEKLLPHLERVVLCSVGISLS